jgi:uncharacterized protein involved in exopolysaccharide biosynthesis
MSDQELPSLFSIVWERRKLAFGIAGAVVAIGLTYTLVIPPVWEAKATLLFPVRTPSLLGMGSFDQTSLAASLSGGPTPLKVFSGMMESERALDFVANGAGIERRRVRDMRTINEQGMQSTLDISARDQDANLAKKVVALHLQALNEINAKISKPLASNDSEVLKAQLVDQRKKLTVAENQLLAFQKRALTAPSVAATGTGKDSAIVPSAGRWGDMLRSLEIEEAKVNSAIGDVQSRTNQIARNGKNLPSALPPVQKWRGRLTDMQYELKIKELTLAEGAPEIVKLKKAIAITEGQLRSELAKYAAATTSGMIDPTVDESENGAKLPSLLTQRVVVEAQLQAVKRLAKLAPGEAMELSRLMREVTTQSTIIQQLQAQAQLAELQAERDPNRWEVLDEPRVDEKPVNKSLSKNGILSLIAGLALGALAAMIAPKRRLRVAQIESIEESEAQAAA